MNKLSKPIKMKPLEKLRWIRILVQIIFFILSPSIYNASFTAVKNTFSSIGIGKPIEMNAFTYTFLGVIGFTILFGRYFCGWACSFGAINDWIYQISHWIQKKTKKRLPQIPEIVSAYMSGFKYIVLLCIVVLCFFQKSSLISNNSPWTVFSLIRSGKFAVGGHILGCCLLAICIIGMCFSERFFCKYMCPMGAVFSLLPVLFPRKRNASKCPEKCGACKRVCPVDYRIEENSLRMGECISCGRCNTICPKNNIHIF